MSGKFFHFCPFSINMMNETYTIYDYLLHQSIGICRNPEKNSIVKKIPTSLNIGLNAKIVLLARFHIHSSILGLGVKWRKMNFCCKIYFVNFMVQMKGWIRLRLYVKWPPIDPKINFKIAEKTSVTQGIFFQYFSVLIFSQFI